ncbi:hypothetical protein B0H16DRAFT_329394 [Mycena metata]|uniref:Uncharacterized protein n=1 Tax=Mycena metata TaxID=1033252 RepID=A0AAD7HNR5_9AGAR|nr:hypothetical protein B0H16DRAFT_329394 [Mycena metata]
MFKLPLPRVAFCLPAHSVTFRPLLIPMARLCSILVPRSFWDCASEPRGGRGSWISPHHIRINGFAPDSQEIARHLGHPLYQLCDEVAVETPFAHVTDGGMEEDNTDQHDTTNISAMSDEHIYETADSEYGDEDEKFGGLQPDILLPSRGVRFLSQLPTVILALVVLCCLSYTTY